jgi:ABC-type uncharacterized transport system ATPase subunit
MLTVNKHMPQGGGLAAVLVRRAATLELDWDMRQKSRFAAIDSTGRELAVVLARGSVLAEGSYAEVSRHPAVMQAYMGTTDGELQGAHA